MAKVKKQKLANGRDSVLILELEGEPHYDREADFRDVCIEVVQETGINAAHWLVVLKLAKKYLDLKEAVEAQSKNVLGDLLKNGDETKPN